MSTPVLVVDDHRTFADLLSLGIDAQPDMHCAGVAHGVQDARRVSAAVPYRAAVVDLGLPDGDGAELVGELSRFSPEARIVVLTAHPRSDLARRALAEGARAVLPKRGRLSDVLAALRDRKAARPPVPETSILTARERQVIVLLSEGLDARAIAEELGLSLYTVRDHVKAILAKLGARTQLEAVVAAVRAGIVLLEPR